MKLKMSKEVDLGKEPIGHLLLILALPSITSQVVNALYNMVDRMYIGHIPEIGSAALTGVGVCFPLIMIISAFAYLLGIPLGLAAALHQNSPVDYVTSIFAILLNAIPGFLVAFVLMIFFSVRLGWFPVSGADSWQSFVLPIIAAGIGPVAQNARMTRSSASS